MSNENKFEQSQEVSNEVVNIDALKKRESKFGKRFFIILTLSLLFVTSITSAIVYIQNMPERIINDMAAQMSTLKSAHYKASVQTEFVEKENEGFDKMQNLLGLVSAVMADGRLTVGDITQPAVMTDVFKLEGDVNALDLNNQKFQLALSLNEFGARVDAKSIGKELYVKLSELPKASDSDEVSFIDFFNLGVFSNQWVKISTEEIEQNFGVQGLTEKVEHQQQAAELTDEQMEQIEKLSKEIKWFEIKEVLGKEMIGEEKVYHYQISLLKEGIREYITRLNAITHQFTDDQLKYFQDGLDEIKETSLDLWIGKSDSWLYKVVAQAEGNGEKVKVELKLSKHNQPIEISAPENYKTLDELIEKRKKARDVAIKARLEQMRLVAELYYESNDYSYLGFEKMEDTQRVFAVIQENNGGNVPVVYNKSDAFCVYSNLATDENTYYCVDSTGRAKKYNAIPKCSAGYYWCE